MYDCEQGFIDQFDRFYTREEALQIMLETNQSFSDLYPTGGKHTLYSEDLY